MSEQVTVSIPIALKNMIINSNKELKQMQERLINEIEEANLQMMEILKLSPEEGWRLDMDNMVYARPQTEEEAAPAKTTKATKSSGDKEES